MRRLLPIAAGVAALCGGVAAASPATPGRIVLAANEGPQWNGEVMLARPNGTVVDLSRSRAVDGPAAPSPDGTRVLFFSLRSGRGAFYVVSAGGGAVRRVSPFLFRALPNDGAFADLSWAPDSTRFAVLVSAPGASSPTVAAGSVRGGWRTLAPRADQPSALAGWSADSRAVIYASAQTGAVREVALDGHNLLDVAGQGAAVSSDGRLAVQRDSLTTIVYDATGKARAQFRGRYAAWSPDGARLATLTPRGVLEIRTAGVGTPVARNAFGRFAGAVQWLGNARVRVLGASGWFGFDPVSARRVPLPAAYAAYNGAPSRDGSAIVSERVGAARNRLVVTRRSGTARAYDDAPPCGDVGAYGSVGFVPGGGVVYVRDCPAPPADIYAVEPDGTGLTRLTNTPQDETHPAVSPDGSTIAYVQRANEVHCPGCTETLWTMNADGSGARAFPNSSDPELNYDESPTFSPDGRTIMFARSGPNAAGLFTVPATGGTVTDLRIRGVEPVWGPAKIAYENLKDGLSVAAPDGSGGRDLQLYGVAAWSPDGRLAVLRSAGGKLSIVLVASRKAIWLPGFTAAYPGPGLAWSPDGRRFAFVAADAEGVTDVWTIGVDGTGLRRVTRDLGAVSTLAWR